MPGDIFLQTNAVLAKVEQVILEQEEDKPQKIEVKPICWSWEEPNSRFQKLCRWYRRRFNYLAGCR